MVPLLLLASAMAAEPTVTVHDDGTVVAELKLPASPDQVREVLADAGRTARLSPDVLTHEVSPEGVCLAVRASTRGPWRPLQYRSLRCPTDEGWRERLVESDDFEALEVEWKLSPDEQGTRVEYRVRSEINVAVPQALVRRGMARSALETLRALAGAVR